MDRALDPPIFIVGCGRSGTTVLYELLCEHPGLAWLSNYSDRFPGMPAVALLHRARWLGRPPKGSRGSSRWRPHPVEGYAIWDRCTGSIPGGINRPLGAADVTREAAERIHDVVQGHVRWQGARRFLNKNTRNSRRIPYLNAVFPEARFVHVLRDPRPTALSLTRVAFWEDLEIWWRGDTPVKDLVLAGCDPIELAAEMWAHEVGEVTAASQQLPDGTVIEVRYEDLVSSPARVIANLMHSLDLQLHPAVERVVGRVRPRGHEPSDHELPREHADVIRRTAGSLALEHGYDLSAS